MPNRFALAILAAALSIPPATAQIRAGAGTVGFGISAGSAGSGASGSGAHRLGLPGMGSGRFVGGSGRFHPGHHSERGSVILAYPYYSDSDYDSREAPQSPQVVVVQGSAPAPPPAPPAPRESLLIEWQGDHFVRTTSITGSAGAQIATDYSEKSAAPLAGSARSVPRAKSAVQPSRELPPAVLVFHDGRQEEVSEYTIMNGTIYSKADYWATGSWTRKIAIADLDVPTTLKLNHDRGLKFALPASSNEVIVRP